MRHLRVYILIAVLIMSVFAALALWIEHEAIHKHEADFNSDQARQTAMAAHQIEIRFAELEAQTRVIADELVPYMIGDDGALARLRDMTLSISGTLYPAQLAMDFFESPDLETTRYAAPGPAGEIASSLLIEWIDHYWPTVQSRREVIVPPLYATPEFQMYGLLYPVFDDGRMAGIFGVVIDFEPELHNFVVPLRSGEYGAAWVQDSTGLVIYDHEPETIGQNVLDISSTYPDLRRTINLMFSQDHGKGEYHYTVETGGDVARKLVAWDTARIGDQRLTIAMSAPDTEINASLAFYRQQTVLLGILLSLTLIASGGLFHITHQRRLEGLVQERTRELEQTAVELQTITDNLEQRVALRTRELDRERAQLVAILDAMSDGLVYYEGNEVKYTNRVLSSLLGYEASEWIGRQNDFQTRLIAPGVNLNRMKRRYQELAKLPRERSGRLRLETRLVRKDGTEFDAAITTTQVWDNNGRRVGSIDIIRDVSHEKALRNQKDNFVTNASHELRRPLTNLKTRLYLLKRQPEKLAEHLEVLDKAIDDMTEVVQDLVDVTQFVNEDIQLNRTVFVLQDLLWSVMVMQQPRAKERRIAMEHELPGEPIPIYADYQRLSQGFNLLIGTVLDYTASPGTVKVNLQHDPSDSQIVVGVQDSGPPMDPDIIPYVLDPFARPSEGTIRSTGLALTLARRVIEQHGGRIEVSSSPEQGNTFYVYLVSNNGGNHSGHT